MLPNVDEQNRLHDCAYSHMFMFDVSNQQPTNEPTNRHVSNHIMLIYFPPFSCRKKTHKNDNTQNTTIIIIINKE